MEGLVSQIHSPHLLVGAPGIFSDPLRSVQMQKREWGMESIGKLLHLSIPGKTAAKVLEFAVENLPLEELQPRFLRLQWRTCPWAEHSDNDIYKGRRVIGISGSLIWSKPLMEQILTPVVNFGEVQTAQLAKSTLLISTLVHLESFQIF